MDLDAFRSLLEEGPLLADGGTGTSLLATGSPPAGSVEAWNTDDPERVESLHRAFVEAGARLVVTNTFGANRFRLREHGLGDRVAEVNAAGVGLARRSGAELVGGSIGPLGVRLAPYGRVQPREAFDAYREQAQALVEAGVDLVVIETQTDLREMEQALAAAREVVPGVVILVSATFTRDDRTPLGSTPEEVAARLSVLGADVIGVNCGEGPAQALRLMRAIAPASGAASIAWRPNAGSPARLGGRLVYPATPQYVADLALAAIGEGAAVVGGCCGTGPIHTAAIAEALLDRRSRARIEAPAPTPDAAGVIAAAAATGLQRSLAAGRFVVAVEMEPPRSTSVATLIAAASTLRDAGADVVDIADSPMAKMRMSAWAACRLVQDEAGIESVLHFPTRGRNLLRLQGDLLGAHALGIRNLFVCVGDPVSIGEYPRTMNDVDVTATGLLELITSGFNEGRDRRGSTIGEPTSFFVGAAVAPAAVDLEREMRLLRRKVRSGAAFLLSQPVYELETVRRMRATYEQEAGEPLRLPLLVGVLPLVSVRHAEFLHNEVPGIVIPGSIRERMHAAGEDAWAEGREIAVRLIAGLREEGVAGVYVMPQFGRYDLAAEVVEEAGA